MRVLRAKMFKLYHFKRINSTNDKAKSFRNCDVIIADVQTLGKGRLTKKWSSGKGGVWMSVVLEPKIDDPQMFTDIAVDAVKKALKKLYDIDTKIKKPNDLLFNGKKLCGILTENVYKGRLEKTIIGIGLNVNNKIPSYLNRIAISLQEITNKRMNKRIIIKEVLSQFKKLYNLI